MYIVSLPVVGVVWFEGRSGGAAGEGEWEFYSQLEIKP